MPAGIGLYLRMSQPEANALRGRLNDIAGAFGYTAVRGPTAGEGNVAALLQAIDAGEVAVVLLPPNGVVGVVKFLRKASMRVYVEAEDFAGIGLGDALYGIADALEDARARGGEGVMGGVRGGGLQEDQDDGGGGVDLCADGV